MSYNYYTNKKDLREIIIKKGYKVLLTKLYRHLINKFRVIFRNQIIILHEYRLIKYFKYNNKELNYFIHPYNITWCNERCIEISIILNCTNFTKDILEVGAVLNNYGYNKHEIIDKYEKGENIKNIDILDYKPNKKYDIIISISTLEHIGYDEEIISKDKPLKVIEHLKKLKKQNGKIIFTAPLGYNKNFDNILKNLNDFKLYYFKRDKKNFWMQEKKPRFIEYNSKYNNANEIVVGVLE